MQGSFPFFPVNCFLSDKFFSHAPPSILNVQPGQHVELRVTKRTEEDYVPPKGTKLFSGEGHRLGAVVPDFSTGTSGTSMPGSFPSSANASTSAARGSSEDKPSISPKFEVDQTLPTTSVQIRLADGTRFVIFRQLGID